METTAHLSITCPEFGHMGYIPPKYTCDGENINPPLYIKNIPQNAGSMVLIVDDKDAPNGIFNHWLVWNIIPGETIFENSVPGIAGVNSAGSYKYIGPCPPEGIHRYFFNIGILDTNLDLREGAPRNILEQAMEGHILAYATLAGLYRRING